MITRRRRIKTKTQAKEKDNMSLFDQAYDEMSWEEVCYRLPSELAINALKRRITNIETLKMFFGSVGTKTSNVKELKEHVNNVMLDYTPEEVFEHFEQEEHPLLFNWTDERNRDRLKNEGKDNLTHKFLYNLADENDVDSLTQVLDHVLAQNPAKQSEVVSVLNKVSNKHFVPLFRKILTDSRPEIRALALSVSNYSNSKLISNHHKVIALKAVAKMGYFDRNIGTLDFSIFSDLKPLERLKVLEIYLNGFPKFKRLKVFDPMPTEDELNLVLFAGCIEHNELVQKLSNLYKEITDMDPQGSEDEEKES